MGLCACIQNDKFRYTLDFKDNYLVYTDYSEWITNSANSVKSDNIFNEYTLNISNYVDTLNGTNISKSFVVKSNLSTIIDYNKLPLYSENNGCLPDGIYKFNIKVCQDTQEYTKVEAVLLNVYKQYEILLKEDNWDTAFEVLKYIEYVKTFANENNIEKVIEYYTILQKILKKIKCNCNEWNLSMHQSDCNSY